MSIQKWLAGAGLGALLLVAACDNNRDQVVADPATPVTSDPMMVNSSVTHAGHEHVADFATKAAVGGLFEVETSRLAVERTKDAALKIFAQRMIDDHTAAHRELVAAIQSEGGNVPPETLDEDHRKKLDDLKAASAGDFDNQYVSTQKDAHDKTIDLFEDYIRDAPAGALKDFATKTLPTLKAHKAEIDKISDAR